MKKYSTKHDNPSHLSPSPSLSNKKVGALCTNKIPSVIWYFDPLKIDPRSHKAPTFLLLREGEGERWLGLSCLVEYFFMSVENKKNSTSGYRSKWFFDTHTRQNLFFIDFFCVAWKQIF
jgi:hypothetical protein